MPLASAPSLFPELEQPTKPFSTGILPSQDIHGLIRNGYVGSPVPFGADQVQPASIDLRLGPTAYRVPASFLPGEKSSVAAKLDQLQMHEAIDLRRPTMLERGCVYIVPLLESLRLPGGISAKANPKSTTGRLDVFTRLITDYSSQFELVAQGYRGPLYVEIVPRTFSIIAREGAKLNQLRFIRGSAASSDSKLDELHRTEGLVFLDEEPGAANIDGGLWLSVDLSGAADANGIAGFRAKSHGLIDLALINHYDVADYWEPIYPSRRGIILEPDDFYILVSREKVSVPFTHAAEMVAYETPIGEFRVHYAGFFDPGFGCGGGLQGTRGVLEIRSHEVPFLLEHGQTVGRLTYERLISKPDKVYGQGIGSTYQAQGLKLSKQFRQP